MWKSTAAVFLHLTVAAEKQRSCKNYGEESLGAVM
jgi:hypothetical protein